VTVDDFAPPPPASTARAGSPRSKMRCPSRPPSAGPEALTENELQIIVCRAPRPKAEGERLEVGLENRLDHRLHSRLHDPVAYCRDRELPPLLPARFRDEDPTRRKRAVMLVLQVRGQLIEQPIDPVVPRRRVDPLGRPGRRVARAADLKSDVLCELLLHVVCPERDGEQSRHVAGCLYLRPLPMPAVL
jgi:hypothetical protein